MKENNWRERKKKYEELNLSQADANWFEQELASVREETEMEVRARYEKKEEVSCIRCNDNGCPACDDDRSGSEYNPAPF